MLWLYLALAAYCINALVFVIDKYLLADPIPKYHAYAFGVSLLSLSAVVLIPFGVSWYGLEYFLISFLSGVSFFLGLTFLYKSIKKSDVSVAATQTGTFAAVFTYLFSIFFLRETLSVTNLFAFLLLILGIFFLGKAGKHIFPSSLAAGLLLGLYFVLLKFSFNMSDFINGLFWTRVGFVGGAFASLVSGHVREEVVFSFRHALPRSKIVFVLNKILAGTGFLILYLAIRLGNVSLINALLGFQFLFIFILVLALRKRMPGVEEKIHQPVIVNKLVGITSILVGFLMLYLGQ